MKRKNHIRLLVTLVLAMTAMTAVVGRAHASRVTSSGATPTTLISTTGAKSAARPADGEPDGGQTVTVPQIVLQHSSSPMGGFQRGSNGGVPIFDWTQWIWAAWLRFPR